MFALQCSALYCCSVHSSTGLSSAVDYSLLQCGLVGSCQVQCSVVQHLAEQQDILSKSANFKKIWLGQLSFNWHLGNMIGLYGARSSMKWYFERILQPLTTLVELQLFLSYSFFFFTYRHHHHHNRHRHHHDHDHDHLDHYHHHN